MPDEGALFQTKGPTWARRASLGGLEAVLSPNGPVRSNLFLHGVHRYGAYQALRYFPRGGLVIDFGCGNGRFSQFFAAKGYSVLGTEITFEMLQGARHLCEEDSCHFALTDGILLPTPDDRIDGIWCCGVLRYSLFVSTPKYAEIAKEMYRVLRKGGYMVNCEVYTDVLPEVFLQDFERAGFQTRKIATLQRYGGTLERSFAHRLISEKWIPFGASASAFLRSSLDNPRRQAPGLRDYLFVWQKPLST